jgi:tetratricopeptide (TPR) repeat protein
MNIKFLFFPRLQCCPEFTKDQPSLQFTQSKAKGTLQGSVRYSTLLIILSLLLVACNNKDTSSPFEEILSQQPFDVITDSIKQQPKNDELYFRRAVLLNKNNFPQPALADFQKAWLLRKHEKYAFGIANIWLEKKTDSAIIFLNQALKQLPESYLLRITLARSYDAMNHPDDALNTCNEILRSQPDLPDVLLFQSELFEKKGDKTNSILSLEKAYTLAPANLEVAYKLAYSYAEDKNVKAVALCDTLIKRDSFRLHADPYYVKGLYYSNINDKAKAIQLFDETIRHDINYLNAYIEKGKILVDQKKTTEALKVFELANRVKPAFPDAYYWIGVCQEALGQKEDAKLSYEKAYSLDKSFTEAKEAAEKLGK